jgi:hypothetical protein
MNNKKFRKIAILVAVMMLVMSFSSTGFASWLDQTIKASYRNITVFVNGIQKQARTAQGTVIEPFIVDGTTYVPLRGISEMLGYQVTFNPTTYRIDITGSDTTALTQKIYQQQTEIARLQALLDDYEDVDLKDLEDDLFDDYDILGELDIEDIKLKGDAKKISVEIYVDLDTVDEDEEWDFLKDDEDELIAYLQDIVDDILREAKDADITGFIENEDDDKVLIRFSINSKDKVVLGSSSSTDGDINDLEDEINSEFDTLGVIAFSYELTERSGNRIQVIIDSDSPDVTSETTKTKMSNLLKDIYILVTSYDDFEDYTIYGKIYDDIGSLDFSFSTSGNLTLEW